MSGGKNSRYMWTLLLKAYNMMSCGKNYVIGCDLNIFSITTTYPWCGGHSTSISASGVWGGRAGV